MRGCQTIDISIFLGCTVVYFFGFYFIDIAWCLCAVIFFLSPSLPYLSYIVCTKVLSGEDANTFTNMYSNILFIYFKQHGSIHYKVQNVINHHKDN